jgi:opacity protein-like surface antigen
LVYGAEIAALSVDGQMPDSPFGNPRLNSVIDLKGRLGYVMGDVLAFGFVGYSSGDWDNDNGLTNPNMTGPNYGIGLDYLIQGSWVIGAEYIQRTMEADFDSETSSIEADFGMVQLRAGYRF